MSSALIDRGKSALLFMGLMMYRGCLRNLPEESPYKDNQTCSLRI